MSAAALSQPHRQPQRGACRHKPQCPAATAGDADFARVVDARPELGWFLLCNGIVHTPGGPPIPPVRAGIGDAA